MTDQSEDRRLVDDLAELFRADVPRSWSSSTMSAVAS